jgi:hypothetical protein
MRTRIIAAVETALILPAAIFMAALVVRELGPQQYPPVESAQQLVMWYAHRVWTLWALLLALPCAALVTGCAAIRRDLRNGAGSPATVRGALATMRADPAKLAVAALTLAAGIILAIVVLHMAAN